MTRKFPLEDTHTRCCQCSFCKIEREANRVISKEVYASWRPYREFALSAKNRPTHFANCWVFA